MNQNPNNPYESTGYGSNPNQPGSNNPNNPNNPNYPYEQFEPTQLAQGGNAYPPSPPPYSPPPPGQGAGTPYPPYGPPPSGQQGPGASYPPYGTPPPGQGSGPYPPYTPPPPNQYPGTIPSAPYSPGPGGGLAPQPQRPSSSRRLLLIGVAVLVIIAAIITAIAIPLHNNQVASDNATATAQTNSTAVAHTATQVAQTNATATAQVNATATVVASTYPFSATPKLNDPLSDNNKGSGWRTDDRCSFSGGAYHDLNAQNNSYYTCPALNTSFSNLTYQMTMQITKGSYAGITFRGQESSSKKYAFVLSQDGSYLLFVYTMDRNPKEVKSGSASSFKTGLGQSNDIGVVARGTSIALYVNKQEVTTITDSTLSSGQIGVIVYNLGSTVEAIFSNAEVWDLGS